MNEESDSSDDSGPPTPKKSTYERFVAPGKPQPGKSPSKHRPPSPNTSPSRILTGAKQTNSPKRNLFSRPSKLNVNTTVPSTGKEKEIVSPLSPLGFVNQDNSVANQAGSLPSTGSASISSLLRAPPPNTHLPPPHNPHLLPSHHSPHQPQLLHPTQSRQQQSAAQRSKSFDRDRESSTHLHQPITSSFFNTTSRTVSYTTLSESDDSWPLICSRVLPLFNGDGLRQPIEDLNRLVSSHLVRITDRREESHVLEDLVELFETGIKSLDNNLARLSDERLIVRLTEIWVFFLARVLPYLEATFLPISIAWSRDPSLYLPSSPESRSPNQLSINNVALKCYRDILILPHHGRLKKILSHLPMLLDLSSSASTSSGSSALTESSVASSSAERPEDEPERQNEMNGELVSRILQSISLLRRVQSGDQAQRDCDSLGDAFLFRRAKGRGDRRGFVPPKTSPS